MNNQCVCSFPFRKQGRRRQDRNGKEHRFMCISHIAAQASGVDDLSEKYTKMKLLKELLNQVFEL